MYNLYDYILILSSSMMDKKYTEFKKRLNFLGITKHDEGYYVLEELISIKPQLENREMFVYHSLKILNDELFFDSDSEEVKSNILKRINLNSEEERYKELDVIDETVNKRIKCIADELLYFQLKNDFDNLKLSENDIQRYALILKPELQNLNLPEPELNNLTEKFALLNELGIIELLKRKYPDATDVFFGKVLKLITENGKAETWRRLYSDYNTGEGAKNYPLKPKNVDKAIKLLNNPL